MVNYDFVSLFEDYIVNQFTFFTPNCDHRVHIIIASPHIFLIYSSVVFKWKVKIVKSKKTLRCPFHTMGVIQNIHHFGTDKRAKSNRMRPFEDEWEKTLVTCIEIALSKWRSKKLIYFLQNELFINWTSKTKSWNWIILSQNFWLVSHKLIT